MKYTAEMKKKEARNDEKTFLKKSAEMTCADTVTNSEIYKKKRRHFIEKCRAKVFSGWILWIAMLNDGLLYLPYNKISIHFVCLINP